MKRQYGWFTRLSIIAAAVLVMSSQAFADESSQFNDQITSIQQHRSQIESQLGIAVAPIDENDVLDGKLFEADKADHYEQVLIMSDQIDIGIR